MPLQQVRVTVFFTHNRLEKSTRRTIEIPKYFSMEEAMEQAQKALSVPDLAYPECYSKAKVKRLAFN